jgi:Holliday junction resolvasome RuvABC endonuclease subunit
MKRLGLDISTACTGWAVAEVDESGIVTSVELGNIELSKIQGLIPKALHAEKVIKSLQEKHRFDEVYVEENMQAFHPGASSAQTIVKLAKFNGIVTFLCHQVTGKIATNVNVNRARKSLGINLQREKVCGISTKEQVFRWVSAHPVLSDYAWPYKTLGSGPRKGTTILEQHAYDMADAFVVVMAGPVVPAED